MPFIKSYYINKIKLTNVPIKSNNFDKFELLIIRNYNQLNKLREENYRFGEWNLKYINNQLLNNCIAISFFKDKKLAHQRWIATCINSKKFVENWPININWKFEACWGNAFTLPKYRNNGLNKLSIKECINFLKSIGIRNVFFTIQKKNYINVKSYSKYNIIKIGEGYYFYLNRFLNFRITIKKINEQ